MFGIEDNGHAVPKPSKCRNKAEWLLLCIGRYEELHYADIKLAQIREHVFTHCFHVEDNKAWYEQERCGGTPERRC